MCETALIAFHLMVDTIPLEWTWEKTGLMDLSWHFAFSGACLHIDLRLNGAVYLDLSVRAHSVHTVASKCIFDTYAIL